MWTEIQETKKDTFSGAQTGSAYQSCTSNLEEVTIWAGSQPGAPASKLHFKVIQQTEGKRKDSRDMKKKHPRNKDLGPEGQLRGGCLLGARPTEGSGRRAGEKVEGTYCNDRCFAVPRTHWFHVQATLGEYMVGKCRVGQSPENIRGPSPHLGATLLPTSGLWATDVQVPWTGGSGSPAVTPFRGRWATPSGHEPQVWVTPVQGTTGTNTCDVGAGARGGDPRSMRARPAPLQYG